MPVEQGIMGQEQSWWRVRHATRLDAPSIAAVHVAAWRTTYRGLLPDVFPRNALR
jgi:hypothetical protein